MLYYSYMAKQKKKRNKVYRGADAASSKPAVVRVSAVKRNKLQQWWFEKKKVAKPIAITTGVIIVVVWLVLELIRALSGS